MLTLTDLLKYGEIEKMPIQKRRGLIREYLQTLILFYFQQSNYAKKVIFIGGTALQFFYNTARFSEDLDFNYLGVLKKENLEEIMIFLQKSLFKENIECDFSIHKSTETYFDFKIYIQFKNILQFYDCSGKISNKLHEFEKLSIQLDFQNLGRKKYPIEKKVISKFAKRFIFNTTNIDMFLAEKSNAILYRKDERARDFFDYMCLIFSGAKINLNYLVSRDILVKSKDEYKKKILEKIKKIDFKKLTKQLSPFLFNNEDIEIMNNFQNISADLLKKI